MKVNTVVLIRSLHCDPEPRVERVINVLRNLACKYTVLAWDRMKKSLPFETKERGQYIRSQIPAQYGSGLRNIIPMMKWQLWVLTELYRIRPTVIHACDLDALIPALIYSKTVRVPLVYDIFDFFAHSRSTAWLAPLFCLTERLLARLANKIIVAHEERINQLGGNFPSEKVLVIYNTPIDFKVNSITNSGDLYFSHVGNLGRDRGLDHICLAFENVESCRLLIGGYGELENLVKKFADKVSNIEFLGRLNHRQALEVQGKSVCIIALYDPKIPNNKLAAPNKYYEALMLGIPIITNEGTILAEEVKREKVGVCIQYGSVEQLILAINRLVSNLKEVREMGQRARKLYENKYFPEKMDQRLELMYRSLLENRV